MSIQNQLFKPDGKNSIHDGIEHSPSGGKALIDPTDTVLLLLDHQTGLFQNVKDIAVADLRRNTTALAKLAALIDLPLIITASIPEGPNGPLMPEIQQVAPHAVYVPRKGEVNAWDNALFVKTVRETGKKTLIIAGVWTNVCVMFPALDAKAEGYNVYVVIDASGDPSELASRTTLARFTQAGVIPTSTNAVTCELHRTWNRPDAAQLAELYCMASPSYQARAPTRSPANCTEPGTALTPLNSQSCIAWPPQVTRRSWRASTKHRKSRMRSKQITGQKPHDQLRRPSRRSHANRTEGRDMTNYSEPRMTLHILTLSHILTNLASTYTNRS